MNAKKKRSVRGLTSDGLLVGMAGVATLWLLVDSMRPDAAVSESQARFHAQQLVTMNELAVAAGHPGLKRARDVDEALEIISSGVEVPSARAFGIEMVRAPELTEEQREEAAKYLRFDGGTLVYHE